MDEEADVSGMRSPEEIRKTIEATRESISETVDKLGDRLQETLDWRAYIRRRPYLAIGAAAGLGLLFSAMLPRARRRSRR